MLSTENRRRYTRVRSAHHVRVGNPDGELETATLDDISLGGLAITGSPSLGAVGGEIRVQIFLSGGEQAEIDLLADVVRAEHGNVAARLKAIDIDSWLHLERLVALNAGDADRIAREFRAAVAHETPDVENR